MNPAVRCMQHAAPSDNSPTMPTVGQKLYALYKLLNAAVLPLPANATIRRSQDYAFIAYGPTVFSIG